MFMCPISYQSIRGGFLRNRKRLTFFDGIWCSIMDRGYRVVEYLQSRIIKRNTCTQNLDNIERTPASNFGIFLRDNHILSKSREQLQIVQCTGTHQTPVTGDFFFRSGIVGIAVGQQRFILAFGAHGEEGRSESSRQIRNTGFFPVFQRDPSILLCRMTHTAASTRRPFFTSVVSATFRVLRTDVIIVIIIVITIIIQDIRHNRDHRPFIVN